MAEKVIEIDSSVMYESKPDLWKKPEFTWFPDVYTELYPSKVKQLLEVYKDIC